MNHSRRVFAAAFAGLMLGVWSLSAEPEEVSPADRAERVLKTADAVAESLDKKDAGEETRLKQEQILKDLDALLKPPPQPPMNQSSSDKQNKSSKSNDSNKQSSPMGGGGGQKSEPMGGGASGPGSMSRREKREQGRGSQQAKAEPKENAQPMPMGGKGDPQPMPKGEPKGEGSKLAKGEPMGKNPMQPIQPMGLAENDPMPPSAKPTKLADLGRGIWGHLPETLRQELNLYYRDQFMPRHGDLLREYYSSISEGDRPRR